MRKTIPISIKRTVPFTDIEPLAVTLTPLVDASVERFYWFYPWLASEYPEVTCTKKYFFTYSTDHAVAGVAMIAWGEGDNLDLSDFVELGIITTQGAPETAYIIRQEGTERPINMFFHKANGDFGIQNTHMHSTKGGLLHDTDWREEGPVLSQGGLIEGDQHLGYFMPYRMADGTYKGMGFKQQSILQDNVPLYQYYTTAFDLTNWDRAGFLNVRDPNSTETFFSYTFGRFFKYEGSWWWIGTLNPTEPPGLDRKKLAVCRATEDLEILEQVLTLNGDVLSNVWSVYIKGDTAHLYMHDDVNFLYYTTWDLLQLKNYL